MGLYGNSEKAVNQNEGFGAADMSIIPAKVHKISKRTWEKNKVGETNLGLDLSYYPIASYSLPVLTTSVSEGMITALGRKTQEFTCIFLNKGQGETTPYTLFCCREQQKNPQRLIDRKKTTHHEDLMQWNTSKFQLSRVAHSPS